MEKDADFPTPSLKKSTQYPQTMHWRGAKVVNYVVRAPARRALFLQILAVFGTMVWWNPLSVDAFARAGEERSYSVFDLRGGSNNEVILQGLPYTANLGRRSTSPLLQLKDDELEEILSVKIKLLRSRASAFRVFINLPDANEQTTVTCPEFSGAYFHEPRRVKSPDFEFQVTTFRIGISEIIKDLGLTDQPSILVTFVPCGADKGLPVVLENMGIELE